MPQNRERRRNMLHGATPGLLCLAVHSRAPPLHLQRCLLAVQVNDVPGAKLSSSTFTKFWVNYDDGSITVGSGEPGSHTFYCWRDPNPIPQIRHAGKQPSAPSLTCSSCQPNKEGEFFSASAALTPAPPVPPTSCVTHMSQHPSASQGRKGLSPVDLCDERTKGASIANRV